MDDLPIHSTFTPFFRRFTDERARDIRELQSLYEEVRKLHHSSPYSAPDSQYKVGLDLYRKYRDEYGEEELTAIAGVLGVVARLETTIFQFPDIKWEMTQLSLREQVDLNRFLTAKRHFHLNQDRVIAALENGLEKILEVLTYGLPATEAPSPFSIPIMNMLNDPKLLIDRLYNVVASQEAQELGIFAQLRDTMYRNMCKASNQEPYSQHKGLKHAMDLKEPLATLADIYLPGTPFLQYLEHPLPLKLSYEDRFSHMHVVGGSGAGKTQLLQHLILNDLMADDPPALIIVDSQSDLIGKISRLALFEDRLKDKLILITPRDAKFPPALNIFDVNRKRIGQYDEETKEQVTAGVIQTFDYLFNGLLGADLTAKQGVFFRFVARLLLALPETMGRNATILDMINLMDDAGPYQGAIESLPPIQRNFFERDFKNKTFAQTKEQIRYRLNAILENPTLARLFTSERTKIDLFTEINNGSIILVDTAKDFLKGSSAHFGRIFISLVLQAVLERAAIPEKDRRPAFLIVDEAAAYFDSNIDDLLTEARKYKLGCVFAHQFLDQATSSLKSSLAANTAIKMAGGISTGDARALAPDMRTTPDFILSQRRLHFACHIRNVTPTAVSIPVPLGKLEGQPRLAEKAYERLREWNRSRVSIPQPAGVANGPSNQSEHSPPSTVPSQPPGDPSAASEDW
jgi:hypothetical protein